MALLPKSVANTWSSFLCGLNCSTRRRLVGGQRVEAWAACGRAAFFAEQAVAACGDDSSQKKRFQAQLQEI